MISLEESEAVPDGAAPSVASATPISGESDYQRPLKPLVKLVFGLLVVLVAWLALTAPLSKSLQPIAAPTITLLAADGEPIARRGAVIEAPVDVRKLPLHVPHAFMAIEDRRFYMHIGVDPYAIARAAIVNLRSRGVREGGSTITQQLAKLTFLSAERTTARKLREVVIAFWLEAWLSKEEILSRYLSAVYFGDNVYGLRAAAHHYFNKDPEDLTVGEAAMLAGMMKAPTRLAPTTNLSGALARAKLVIAAMVDSGLLSEAEAKRARPARLHVARVRALPTGTYFADWILPQARGLAGDPYGARTIKTTLDSRLQRMAAGAVRRAGLGGAQVALVAMRPDGEVVAMVGGKNYAQSPFNRVTQARRQPGSTFKLFVYLAALRAGMDPDTAIEDAPITIDGWSPKNSTGRYRGTITLREAFATSSNVAAVRLSEKVGRSKVIQAARDLGITSPLAARPSLALGTSGVTLLELTAAYAGIASNSYPVEPRGLPEVRRSWFERFWNNRRRFDTETTLPMLLDLLSASANEGTGRAAALKVPTFGKTGTTQDNRDAIFVGFAGDLVTAVWVGNDDNSPLPGVAGGGLPARIWRDFMAQAVNSMPAGQKVPVRPPAVIPDAEDEPYPPDDRPIDEIEVNIDLPALRDDPDNGFQIHVRPADPSQPPEPETADEE